MLLKRDIVEKTLHAYQVRRGDFVLVVPPQSAFPVWCSVLGQDEIGKWVELVLLDPSTGETFDRLMRSMSDIDVRMEA